MIDNMLKTRKIALAKKKKLDSSSKNKSDLVTLTEIWYEEFLKLHPDYKSSKKNLWRKYKWYKARIAEVASNKSNNAEIMEAPPKVEPETEVVKDEPAPVLKDNLIRMKSIRKDVFHYLKAVLEESRVFLPMKLPEEPMGSNFMMGQHVPGISAHFPTTNNTDWPPFPIMPIFPQEAVEKHEQEVEDPKADSIKLPGGATLVAMTDKNADMLLKPKQLEKPHVTITIGDKEKQLTSGPHPESVVPPYQPTTTAASLTAIVKSPNLQIPLSIPFPIHVPQFRPNVPPPLSQLHFVPARIQVRLDELGMGEDMFMDLLRIYEKVRDEYMNTLKRGFLVFFPYLLGARWREQNPTSYLTGRKLTTLVDMYIEEKRKGRIVLSPEYLTKVPCGFVVTELMMKQIHVCHAEIRKNLNISDEQRLQPDRLAVVYAEMCKRWAKIHPEIRLTTKQMISIHHMLNYEPGKDDPSPEIVCNLTEIYRILERDVPKKRDLLQEEEQLWENNLNAVKAEEENVYDESTISFEQLQEWFLATQEIPLNRNKGVRPSFKTNNLRLYWSTARVRDLTGAHNKAFQRWKCHHKNKRKSIMDLMYLEWKHLHPQSTVTKHQMMSRYNWQTRIAKRRLGKLQTRQIEKWRQDCNAYVQNEENVQVICPEDPEVSSAEDDGFNFQQNIKRRSDDVVRDYNRDDDVLSYITELQKNSKSHRPITWTPDVIADLISARKEARRRKRVWEEWAIKKYGGVGIAYNTPNVKFLKVDEMFKEEWAKRRPALSNLSIWTLVSYARKFDTLKKQLVLENNQVYRGIDRRRKDCYSLEDAEAARPLPTSRILYLPGSSIPKYDLDELDKLAGISRELKDLIRTRQLAKLRQQKGEDFTLHYLWRQEWIKDHPESGLSGFALHQRLWLIESSSAQIRSRLRQVVLRTTSNSSNSYPEPNEDDLLTVKPRHLVFPEADDEGLNVFCYIDIQLPRGPKERWYVELERDVYRKDKLFLPMLEDGRGPADEEDEVVKFHAKAYNYKDSTSSQYQPLLKDSSSDKEKFTCPECNLSYENVNNLQFHRELHSTVSGSLEDEEEDMGCGNK